MDPMLEGMDGGVAAIELAEKGEGEADPDYQSAKKETAAKASYTDRFEPILKGDYNSKKSWWKAVDEQLKKDDDFIDKVSYR